jgi:hypothetical protein
MMIIYKKGLKGLHLLERTDKYEKYPSIAGLRVEIRTRELPHTKQRY